MISLKQIHYALAVERTLHFKKAAEECHISQSALSTALAELEKQLGFQIFERDNRKVLVTPLGAQVLRRGREIALQVEDLQKLAEAQREPLSTPLTLGVIPTIGPYLLPRVLPALQKNYPALQLDFTEDQSLELLDLLRRGALDTAILALPFDCEGLLTFSFWEEDLFWVTNADDPLAAAKRITTDELRDSHLMLLKDGHCLKEHAVAACHLEDLSSHRLSATSLATLIQLVAAGMGSTLVPGIALQPLIEGNPKLVAVPLAEPGPHRQLAFVVRPNYPGVANIEALIKLFRGQLQAQI